MKVFIVGDFFGKTGPSIANQTIRKGFKNEKNITYSDGKNKLTRIIEIFFKTMYSDCVCICGFSKSNLLVINIAKLFNKKMFYIMHGYSTYEAKINNKNITKKQMKKINDFETKIFENVDKIFCVSKLFMEFMQKSEPKYINKFSYNYNGIDISDIERKVSNHTKKKNQIVSIGGGMPQKNNLEICKAISKLNEEKKMNLKYVVVGKNTTNKDEINKYDFVTYIDELSHNEVLELMSKSYLYIQNSDFETFGLSIIEALLSNCNLLVSHNIGATGVINSLENKDLIFNSTDINEITSKIEKILLEGNASRLRKSLDVEKINYKKASRYLLEKMENV